MPFPVPNGTWVRTRSNKDADQVLFEQREWARARDRVRRRRGRLGSWVRGTLAVGFGVGVAVLIVQAVAG